MGKCKWQLLLCSCFSVNVGNDDSMKLSDDNGTEAMVCEVADIIREYGGDEMK